MSLLSTSAGAHAPLRCAILWRLETSCFSVVLEDDEIALFAGANGSSLLDQAQERIDISHPELAPDTDRSDGRVGYFDLAYVVAIQFRDDVAERRIPESNVPLPPRQIFGFDLRDGLLSHQ